MEKIKYEEAMKVQYAALDTIDFAFIFKIIGEVDIDSLREAMHRAYDHTPVTENEVLKGCITNYLTDDELVEYLKKRYGNKFSACEYSNYYLSFDEDEEA